MTRDVKREQFLVHYVKLKLSAYSVRKKKKFIKLTDISNIRSRLIEYNSEIPFEFHNFS